MEARMKNPAMILPGAMTAIQGLYKEATSKGGVPQQTLELVHLRASQIIPDLVRYGVGAVAEAGHGFGEGQGGAFGVGEIGGLAPGRYCKEAFVGLACLLGGTGAGV